MSNGYDILKGIIGKETHSSFEPSVDPLNTPRMKEIIRNLPEAEIALFSAYEGKDLVESEKGFVPAYVNLYARVGNDPTKKTIILLAHHDVNNPKYENANDNTASVANLISLYHKLKEIHLLKVNVVIAIVDAEEICSFELSGSARLARDIKSGLFGEVKECINLELSGRGSIIFGSGHGNILNDPCIEKISLPYNDAKVLHRYGITACCVGLYSTLDSLQVKKTGYCDTWSLCHEEGDTLSLLPREDMAVFTNYLYNYVVTAE